MSPKELILASVGALVAVASAVVSWRVPERETADVPRAAVAFESSGDVKRRPAEQLGWRPLGRGMGVFDADAVFVPPGATSALRFDDGSELFLDERSLVVVERATQGRRLRLRQGALSGRAALRPLAVETPAGLATIEAQSDVRVELSASASATEVTVRRGAASLGSSPRLQAGERARAGPRGVERLPGWPVQLVEPESNARQAFSPPSQAVVLRWTGALPRGARLQLARDRLFAFVELDGPVRGQDVRLERRSPEVTWWRLVDERGAPLSESRRFALVEDVPPVAIAPAPDEVMLAPPGSTIAFEWTYVPGAERYRVELAAAQDFEVVVLAAEVPRAAARLEVSLPEGSWYWRVRAVDGDTPHAGSVPRRFRLIHKAIPDAPELLKPELELGDE